MKIKRNLFWAGTNIHIKPWMQIVFQFTDRVVLLIGHNRKTRRSILAARERCGAGAVDFDQK